MPPVIIAAIAYAGSYITLAQLVLVTVAYGLSQYQASRARRKARDAYNASLQDRLVMQSTVDGARSRCYGRVRNVDGILFKATRGDKSQYYTLVIALCGHEIDGVEHVLFGDTRVTLDAQGWVRTTPWARSVTSEEASSNLQLDASGNVTYTVPGLLAGVRSIVAPSIVAVLLDSDGSSAVLLPTTVHGSNVTVVGGLANAGRYVALQYQTAGDESKARVRVYNGGDGQDLSTELAADFPGLIVPGAHRFAGIACLRVDLTYDEDAFATGVPNPISAIFRAARVYDPRTGVTAWSENPALIARDWALHANGGAMEAADLVAESFVSEANVCDVVQTFTTDTTEGGSPVVETRATYTCGIVCDTSVNPLDTLGEICEAMAGQFGWPGGQLAIRAGAYRAPGLTVSGDWLHDGGSIDAVKDAPLQDLVNVLTPSIANAANDYVAAPIPRVAAAAYITEDGQEHPDEQEYLGITSSSQASHVAAVSMRYARAARTYQLPLQMQALQLKLFHTYRFDIPEVGLLNDEMEVVAWELDLDKCMVTVSVKATGAGIYDPDTLFVREDAMVNPALPNPFVVPSLAITEVFSGTATLLRLGDGTLIPRVRVRWAEVQDEAVRAAGAIELRWRRADRPSDAWYSLAVPGSDTEALLGSVEEGVAIVLTARARNKLVGGAWTTLASHIVVGKQQPPAQMEALSATVIPGAVRVVRSGEPEIDWSYSVYEYSTDGGTAWQQIPAASGREGVVWPAPPLGAVLVRGWDVDASGLAGAVRLAPPILITSETLYPTSTALGIKINVGDFAGALNWSEAYIHGIAGGVAADAAGSILVNGVVRSVPAGVLYTNRGPVDAWIVWDMAGVFDFSPLGVGVTRPYAMCRRTASGWQYDNNYSDWVAFTPSASHVVIGSISTGAPDANAAPGITSATMFAAALTMSAVPLDVSELLNSNIQVGARNLLIGASNGAGWSSADHVGDEFWIERASVGETGYLYSGYITLPASTKVTLSFESRQDGPVSGSPDVFILPDDYAAYGLLTFTYPASTDWVANKFTFTTPASWAGLPVRFRLDHNGSPSGVSRTYRARRIKLELGEVATDWTPPVEDVAADATDKAAAAQAAAQAYAAAQAALAETTAKAYADGQVDAEEARAIADAQAKANAAQAAAISAAAADATAKASAAQAAAQAYAAAQAALAETTAKAYADGQVDAEEARAIADAQAKANAAQAAAISAAAADATAKANVAATMANWSGVSGRPYDYEQEGAPAGATEGSNWRVPSTGKTYRLIGGTWQAYVGVGSVGTAEIADGAVLDVLSFEINGPVTAWPSQVTLQRANIPAYSVNTKLVCTASLTFELNPSGTRCWGQAYFNSFVGGVGPAYNTPANTSAFDTDESLTISSTFDAFAAQSSWVDLTALGQGSLDAASVKGIRYTILVRKR